MNYFQFNYTTYAQSIRLLEMGMPYKTADVYSIYDCKDVNRMIYAPRVYRGDQFFPSVDNKDQKFPMWSGLRLIELYEICFDKQAALQKGIERIVWNFSDNGLVSNIDYIINAIDVDHRIGIMDFSRLNDWMNR